MRDIFSGYATYIIGGLLVALGVYQFFTSECKSGIETILLGAGFMGLRRAIG